MVDWLFCFRILSQVEPNGVHIGDLWIHSFGLIGTGGAGLLSTEFEAEITDF